MKIHITTTICDVCGCEGAATYKTAALSWVKGSFVRHTNPSVCAENLRRKKAGLDKREKELNKLIKI